MNEALNAETRAILGVVVDAFEAAMVGNRLSPESHSARRVRVVIEAIQSHTQDVDR